jgi:hypothetical protein
MVDWETFTDVSGTLVSVYFVLHQHRSENVNIAKMTPGLKAYRGVELCCWALQGYERSVCYRSPQCLVLSRLPQ